MRPEIDVPHELHGQVENHAMTTGKSIDQSYIDALRDGLGTDTESGDRLKLTDEANHGAAFGPRMVPVSDRSDSDSLRTYLPQLSAPSRAISFRSKRHVTTQSTFNQGLAWIEAHTDRHGDDWFTIEHPDGAWIGSGSYNFGAVIQTAGDQGLPTDGESGEGGNALYVREIDQDEYLLLHVEFDLRESSYIDMQIGFLTDGYPIDGTPYTEMIEQFGMSRLSTGMEPQLQGLSVPVRRDYDLTVVETIASEDIHAETVDPYVGGVIAENPFQQNDHLKHQFERAVSAYEQSQSNTSGFNSEYSALTSHDHVFLRLAEPHPEHEDHVYELGGISLQHIPLLFPTEHIFNIALTAAR